MIKRLKNILFGRMPNPPDATKFYNGAGLFTTTGASGGGITTSTGLNNSGRPVSPTSGDLFFPTNGPSVQRYNGSVWKPWGPVYPMTELIDADFAWVNQGAATLDTTSGTSLIVAPAVAADNIRIRAKTAPATPYTITAYIDPIQGWQSGNTSSTYGLGFRQSSDGKLHLLMLHTDPTGNILSIKFTDPTTFSALYSTITQASLNLQTNTLPIKWLRISDDGSIRSVGWSYDGLDFTVFATVGRTDFLTANQVLWFANTATINTTSRTRLHSWTET